MNQARAAILQRLRQGRPADFAVPESDFTVVRQRNWSLEERIERFQQKIESVQGQVHRVAEDHWIPVLIRLLAEHQINNLLLSENKAPAQALREQWHEDLPSLLSYQQPLEAWKETLFNQVDAALTSCRGGIAETGSLILWPDADEPRLMSLVPPVHFVLLQAKQIYATFDEVLREQAWVEQGLPTNALLISGPSKTADIEQTLAYGVHGPKALIVLLLE